MVTVTKNKQHAVQFHLIDEILESIQCLKGSKIKFKKI